MAKKTRIWFSLDKEWPRDIYWTRPDGSLKLMGTILPGRINSWSTWLDHLWITKPHETTSQEVGKAVRVIVKARNQCVDAETGKWWNRNKLWESLADDHQRLPQPYFETGLWETDSDCDSDSSDE